MYDKTNVQYRSKVKNPLFYDKTNVQYKSMGNNPFFYYKTNFHYRIRGKDALVRASMGKLTPWHHLMIIVTTLARCEAPMAI